MSSVDPNNIKVDWSKVVTVSNNSNYICRISTNCLICEEQVDLNEYEERYVEIGKPLFKICDKCKAAVMKIRKEIEN